jgi:hypothetical protein
LKLTIGVPYSGAAYGVSPSWALALRKLVIPCNYDVHVVKGFPVQTAREYIARLALEDKSDYLLMLDADVIPEREDALVQLMGWRLPIVCGVYALKRVESNVFPLSIFKREEGAEAYRPMTWSDVPKGHRLVEIDGSGLGFTLIDMSVFKALKEPWFEWDIKPWEAEAGMSEDIMFFDKLWKELGIKAYADVGVPCLHVLAPGLALNVQGQLQVVL